jgi:signal peptidase I
MKNMAEQQISIPLAMATTTTLGSGKVRSKRRGIRFSRISFNLFLQKTAVLALVASLSVAAYLTVSHFFLKSVQVVGVSMVPTLAENNHYILNLWELHHRDPQRNDIVVIRDPGDHGLSVKRIIAVPGESVLFKEGKVYVDGKKLNEPYLAPDTLTFTYSQNKEQFITCGKDQYFVLGDNRLRSIDSRAYGAVSREGVLGLVKVP